MAELNYNITVTGDCSNNNSGAFNLFVSAGTPPYTVQFLNPSYASQTITIQPASLVGLASNVYQVRVNDSSLPTNNEFLLNIPVSSGVCGSIVAVQNTTCGVNNGSVTGSSTSLYSSTNFSLYDINNNYLTSASTNTNEAVFGQLSAGTYYLGVTDLGGCTAFTQTFIVEESDPLDFGLYVVPNSSCGGIPIGKIFVTGQTGQAPYSYLWSNAQTGSTITGLTSGTYSVEVTDAYGCVLSKSATITDVNPVGLGLFTSTAPTCLQSNGVINMTITGGTAPFYYSASTGDVLVSYSRTFTLSSLSAGQYNFQVTDAGLCQMFAGTTLETPGGLTSVTVQGQNSTCSSTNGSITVNVAGGTSPYTYTLIYPTGNQLNISNSQTTQIFGNLSGGTYTVGVSDNTGCSYLEEVTLVAQNKFTISTQVVGTSCNQNNGSVTILTTTGGTLPLDYSVDGIQNVIDTNLTAVTFNNLTSGTHVVTVTDADGCVQTTNILVPSSQALNYSLYSTSCGSGSSGKITAFITSGEPPFSFNWSDNVPNEPQQIQVSGLTAGTYSLTVVDANGCSLTRSATITCNTNSASYQTYVMGAEVFNIQSPTKFGLLQMLNEGFFDLTSGNTSCDLISATFTAKVSVNPSGIVATQNFFTSTSLVQVPTDNQWYDTIRTLLLGIPGVGNVIIDQLNNQITIETSRNNTSLEGEEIVIDLVIDYNIICLT
jgi:large repetitive protein